MIRSSSAKRLLGWVTNTFSWSRSELSLESLEHRPIQSFTVSFPIVVAVVAFLSKSQQSAFHLGSSALERYRGEYGLYNRARKADSTSLFETWNI